MMVLEWLRHSLLDTAKLLPFLFLTYLLMEFLEHRSGDAAGRLLRRSGKIGPLIGGALGVVPQCGFSAAASALAVQKEGAAASIPSREEVDRFFCS